MWRDEQDILDDLQSKDAPRVADGLRDLEERMDSGADEFPLPPLTLDILQPFAGDLPIEVQHRLLRIVDGYQSFNPPQSDADKYAKVAALSARWGDHKMALEGALVIKRAADPARATRQALDALARGEIDTRRALRGAQYFASLLVDGAPPVRRAAIEAMAAWPKRTPFSDVLDYVLPQLDPDEVAALGR
jgi:hypothetical protein